MISISLVIPKVNLKCLIEMTKSHMLYLLRRARSSKEMLLQQLLSTHREVIMWR